MGTNKMREQFECYWVKQLWAECYEDVKDQMFAIWQASREAVVVELPPKISPHNTTANEYVRPEAEHYDEAIDDCREAIEALGLRVKP